MALNGDAIRSAGRTFVDTFSLLKGEQRKDRQEARQAELDAEEARWRRVTMAMQEKQDARAQQSHDATMEQVGLQLEAMHQDANDAKAFMESHGGETRGQWEQRTEEEKFELYKQMQGLTMRQIETNITATQASMALQKAAAGRGQAEDGVRAERERMQLNMTRAEYDDFMKNKGVREAGQVLDAIQQRLGGVNDALKAYTDYDGQVRADAPEELLRAQAELTKMQADAVNGQFSDALYSRLGIDRTAVKAGSSPGPETEEQRLQRLYGAAGAAERSAASEKKLLEGRAAAIAAEPRNSQYFYVDVQGKLQATNDAKIIADLEKVDPERVLDPRLVHPGYIGQLYSPRRSSPTWGRGKSETYRFSPEEEMQRQVNPFNVGF